MKYKCSDHPDKECYITYSNLKKGHGCPYCIASKGEKRIDDWLTMIGYNYIRQYEINELLGIGGKPLKFDFAVFENNKLSFLIEYDGEFHFRKQYQGDSFEKIIEHDKRKNKYCKRKKIRLIRIPYTKLDCIENVLSESI